MKIDDMLNPNNTINQTLQNSSLNQTIADNSTVGNITTAPARNLNKDEIVQISSVYTDMPFVGGQNPPMVSKWLNENTFMFLQFDKESVKNASDLRYFGLGVRTTFCKETNPAKEFVDFKRYSTPDYGKDDYYNTEQGYFLMRIATDSFTNGNQTTLPGIDYAYSKVNLPICGSATPPKFSGPGAKDLSKDDILKLSNLFSDNPFTGGQKSPVVSKWVNNKVFIFLKFDTDDPKTAKEIQYIGIGKKGKFCKSDIPSGDFVNFQRLSAATFDEGRGGIASDEGYWMLWVAVDHYSASEKNVSIGVDRTQWITNPPDC